MENIMAKNNVKKKPYSTPAIIYDLDLETKAGSPLSEDLLLQPPLE